MKEVQEEKRLALDQFPTHEEIIIDSNKQDLYISKSLGLQQSSERDKEKVVERKLQKDMQELPSPQTERKNIPPPKPPRTDLIEAGVISKERKDEAIRQNRQSKKEETGSVNSEEVKEEIKKVVRRVSSIVDMNDAELTRVAKSTTPVMHGPGLAPPSKSRQPVSPSRSPIPKPRLVRRRSKSSDGILCPASIVKAFSNNPRMMRAHAKLKQKPKISHLIQMFEPKSPGVKSPRKELGQIFKWSPPSPRQRSYALSEVSSGESVESSPSHSRPYLPPKPQNSAPPVPPRPLSCTGEGPPVLPPRTPAPLIPPKPPGTKAPTLVPRMARRRSHSDSDSKVLNDDSPPRVPPK